MKFQIITLGCKVNTYESEFMLERLLSSGYLYNEENPDIIIINTCSVTNTADSKSKKIIRRAKRENPNAIIVACGCSTQNHQAEYQELGIDILLGNRNKSNIVALIETYLKNHEEYTYFTNNRDLDFENMTIYKFTTHTRAFIKIQDGCNNFCSYCIIPYTRGNIRSKDFTTTINEVKTLVKNGHKEIVLTGIHTGSYNSDGHDLSDLLVELAKITALERIRISSIEITELDTKFLNVLKTTPKICNHLHIPLQSGSEAILKRMNRKYDKAYFRNKIAEIRAIRPDISITTDAIVGHPYETDADFAEYLKFCEEINFSKIHVFPYSLRSGTAAALMPQVAETVKKERAHKLLALSSALENAYLNKFLNKKVEVLTEEYVGDYICGHTSN
ncbi:MAG: tRNA (N(6)-L-threonylcarbamoyladenosine(37)-C(2))-methylthiotransferase MtaB, partial [Bacilli bacterium]|nr:tRNA (N(6)-L-threonylcarbamoyladenosine(37)-C(2))-methylthiotransferase MtaB [Bacilli bacterium]